MSILNDINGGIDIDVGVLVKRDTDEDNWEEPKRDTDGVDREELEWNLSCWNKIPCK